MTDANAGGRSEPRHFWRRGFAFLLDALIANLVAALLFAAIHVVTGISLGPAFTTYRTQCAPAPSDHPQVARVDILWPLPAGAQRENLVCDNTINGQQSRTFVTRVIWKDGITTYRREVAYPVDANGKALPVEYELDLTSFAVVLFFVVLTAHGRRTPGKAMLSLRVRTERDGVPGWGHAVRREVLKLLPLVLLGLLMAWTTLAPPAVLTDSEASIVGMRDGTFLTSPWMLILLGWCAFSALWWFAPFALWRGRTWHDALAGTKLIRSGPSLPSAPRQP
jgi:hypothetical protein